MPTFDDLWEGSDKAVADQTAFDKLWDAPEPRKRESGVSPSLLQLPFGSDWPAGEAPSPKELIAQGQTPLATIPSAVVNPQGGRAQAVAKESYNLVKSVPEFFSSPIGVGTLVNAPFLGRLVPAVFFLQTLGQMGEEGRRLKENYDTMTPAERWGAYTRIVGSGVFAGFMGKAATHVRPEAPVPPVLKRGPLPEATKAAEEAGVKVEETPGGAPEEKLLGPIPEGEPTVPMRKLEKELTLELEDKINKEAEKKVATEESSLPAAVTGEGELVAPEQTAQAPSKAPEAVVAAPGEPATAEGGAKVAQSQPEESYAKGKVEETGGVPAVERVAPDIGTAGQAEAGTAQRGGPGEEAQGQLPVTLSPAASGSEKPVQPATPAEAVKAASATRPGETAGGPLSREGKLLSGVIDKSELTVRDVMSKQELRELESEKTLWSDAQDKVEALQKRKEGSSSQYEKLKLEQQIRRFQAEQKKSSERIDRISENAQRSLQAYLAGKGDVSGQEVPSSVEQSLSTLPAVKVKVPEGATQIRITTPQGKKAVQSVASVNKGDNPFRGVDIKKVEAGTIDRSGKFKPLESKGLISVGPGAQTAGESPYPAISQLTDQLNGVKNKGVRESLSARDKLASAWSKGKSLTDSSIALMRAASTTAKEMFRGIRDINDLERNLSKFDDVLQTSSGRSVQAKSQMLRQVKSETDRNAAALLVDSGFDQTKIADALSRLPAGTDPVIRKAMERASNPTREIEDFAHSIEQFFSLRERDARLSDIFENGLRDYYTHIWQKEQNMPDRLRAALTSGRVSTYFQFSRQRQIPTLIEGILLGKKPILDPANVVPFYNYAMDRSIASRELVKSLTDVTMSDGRPLVEVSGVGKVVDSGTKPTVVIKPKVKSGEMQGYEVVNHPAMKAWKWVTQSEDGTPVILQGDLLVHPEGFERLARIMDRHRLTPTATMRNLLRVGGEVKGFKLGLLSAFHDVHVASHAVWHWTNPFKSIKGEVDFDDPFTHFAIEKGHVKLAPNPAELNVFSEGIGPSSLAEKVPLGIGRVSKAHAEWLFGTFIPNLKLNTFRNAYNRAIWMRDKMGAYKGLSDEQIASRIGDSVNSAYGELNQMFMGKYGRDPSFQRLLRLIFLAPDFGEARLRFVGKAFTKYGHEERIALATMALGLYGAARVANWMTHGDPEFKDIENAFRVKTGSQWWSMRSVIGDVLHAIERPGQFFYVRLNPVYSRTLADLTFGRDAYTGRKLTAVDKAKRLGEQIIPINVTPLTKKDREWWHSLTQSIGVYATRDTAAMDISKLASEWNLKQGKPQPPEFIPGDEASYSKLRMALQINNQRYAKQVLTDLLKSRSQQKVAKAMEAYVHHPFTGNRKDDFAFYATLTDLQKKQYGEALKQRKETWEKFRALMAERNK